MRLPTAVEWEYAARAAAIAPRYGSPNEIAWYDANSSDTSHDVRQKQPNAFGLYDMLGNMWEWVADTVPQKQDQRQLRGGAFTGLAKGIRASSLNWAPPETAHRNMGFRCAANALPE
jgi:formylglycine-generating enzyme required for sulfatase activity